MQQPPNYVDAIAALEQAHNEYKAALLPHPETNKAITYAEYDNAMNEALENLESVVDAILREFRER